MNHFYRLIWNHVQNCWQVAHEAARSRGKGRLGGRQRLGVFSTARLTVTASMLTAISAVWADPADHALPTGANVVHGAATIELEAARLRVNQHTDRLITNWDSFDIGRRATVTFHQPSASSVALNRINNQSPTEIFGRLESNGHVILSNTSGVIFGKTAVVDVGALTATALQLKDEDFLAGRFKFQGASQNGGVINFGDIQAGGGVVALIAPKVVNSGVMQANGGTVALAAGSEVTLDFTGSGLYTVTVKAQEMEALVQNSGAVIADDGLVILSAGAAGSLLKGLVNHSGTVQARSLVQQGGRIVLTGREIALEAGSTVDASGSAGGGVVHIGGEWQGHGNTRQANQVSLDAGATIRADATDSGHGGEVVLWSDINDSSSLTRVEGDISAQGKGPQSQGGRVETSGAELAVSGSVVTGAGGQWLIDPANIYVTSNGATSATAGTNTAGSSNTFINSASINAALDTGASVELYTGSTTANANQIHIQANITKSAGAASTLTLRTGGLIRVDSSVRIADTAAANPLSVTLETSGPIYLADNNSATPTVSIHGDLTMGAPVGGNAKGYVVNGSTDRTYQHGVYIGQHVGLSANNITVKGQGFDFTHSSFDGRVYDGGDGVHIAQSAVLDATSNLSVSGVGGVGSRGSQGTNGSTGSNGSNAGTGASYGNTISTTVNGNRTLNGRDGGDAIGGQGGTGGSGTAGGIGGNGGRGVFIASVVSLSADNVAVLGTGGVGGIGGAGGKGGTGGTGGQGGTGGTGQNADLKNRALDARCFGGGTTSARCEKTYAGTANAGRGGDANGGKGGTGGRGGDGGAGGNGGVGVMVMTAASIQGTRGNKVVGVGGRAGQGGTGGAGGQGGNGGQGGQGGRGGDGGNAYTGTAGGTTSTTKKSFSGNYFRIYSESYAGVANNGRDGYRAGGVGGDTGRSGAGGAGGDSGEGVRYESAVLAGAQVTTTAHITETGASGNQGALGARGSSGSRGTRGGSVTFGSAAFGGYGGAYNSQRVGIGLRTTGATTIGSASEVTNISLITDTVRMDTGALVQTAAGGTLLVRPDTSGRFINLGSSATAISSISNSGTNTSTSQAKLNLSQDYFWNGSTGIFKDGFSSITIGSAASNNIVGSNLSFGDQLNLVTGQNITFTGSLTGAGQTLTTQVGSGKTGNFSSATVNVASLAIHSDANNTANWGTYTFGANTSTANEILNVAGRPQALTLYNAKPLTIGTVDGITGIDALGDVIIRTDNATQANTGITFDAGAYVHTESNTATAIMLDAGLGAFDNNSGLDLDADDSTFTLATGAAGRWLVFSGEQDPTLFAAQRGGIAHQFKQYNLDWTHATTGATYAFTTGSVSTAEGNFRVGTNTSNQTQSAAIAEAATNGFIYRYAPSLTPEITQKVTKVYNRNASATVTTAHLVNGADADAIDGDTVRLTATSTGGTYFTTAGANDSLGRVEEEAITFASTANQIVFNAGVDLSGAGLEVWVRENLGATYTQLDADTDFTVSGSTVTLTAARQSGDIVQIVPSDLDGDGVTLSDVRSDKKVTLANSSIVWQADNDGVNVYGYRITTAAQGYVGEITKKPLTVSGVTVSNFSDGTYSVTRGKVYDGSTVASISLGTANLQGTLSGDSVTLNKPSGGACTNVVTTNCYLADYLTPNAGDNIGVTIRGIYLSSTNQASNYTLEGSASATGMIAPKVLDVTGTTVKAKPYDGTTLATIMGSTIGVQTAAQRDAGTNVRSKDGLLVMREDGTTDSVSLTVSGNYINKNASTLDANVTYQITGADAANYTLDPGFRTNANKKQTAMWQLHDGADGAYKHRITSNVSVIQTSTTSGFSTTTTGHQIASNGETVESLTVNYSNGAIAGAASTPTSVAGIYKAPLTVIANDIEKVPGGADPTLTRSYSGFVAGETDAVLGSKTISRVAGEVPGTYTITAGATSNNYDITFVPGTFTIAPAEKLVIQINDASRDYGALTVAGTHYNVNASGAQYSTAQASITQSNGTNATFSGPTAFDVSKGGGVYLWNSGTSQWELVDTADYIVSGNSITLNTAPASGVDVKVISQYSTKVLTVTRDSSDPTKFILDDGLGTRMSVSITSDDTQSSDIGQYTVSVVNPDRVVTDQIFRNSSASSLTLTHSFVVGKGSVWKNGSLLSSANDYSVSGTTLTLQSPLSSSDELRVISDYDSRITLYQPNNGGQPAAPNFNTIASAGGVLTINPVEAQIGIGGGTPDKVYDGTTSLGLNPSLSLSNPAVATDALAGAVDVAGIGAFVSADAGSFVAAGHADNYKVNYTVSGLSLSGTKALNYYLTSDTQTSFGYIRPKALTVVGSAAANKTYDGNSTAIVTPGTLSGLVGDEVINLAGVTASFASEDVARGANGAVVAQNVNTIYTLTDGVATVNGQLTTFKASNYTAVDASQLTARILPKSITVNTAVASVSDKTYDGLLSATMTNAGSLQGLVGSEMLALSAAGVFENADAGENKTVNVSFSIADDVASGGAVSNYSLANPSFQTTATISPRVLTLSGVQANDKTYDGLTEASVSFAGVNNLVANETLAITPVANFSTKNVVRDGSGSAVDQAVFVHYQLGDGLNGKAANYSLAGATLQATINPATLQIANMVVANKVYDGLTSVTLDNPGFLDGLVSGDAVTLKGAPVFDSANAGVRVVQQGTLGINGTDAGNYTLSWTNGSAEIAQAPLQIRALNDAKFVTQNDASGYQGVVYSGFVNGETASALNATPSVNRVLSGEAAGFYENALQASGASATNYAISYVPGNYTIVPADQLLVRVQNTSTTYGTPAALSIVSAQYLDSGSNSIATLNAPLLSNGVYTYADGSGGQASFTLGALSPSYSSSQNLRVGAYNVGATSVLVSSENFSDTLTVVGGLTVTQKSLSPVVGGVSKVYDGSTAMTNLTLNVSGKEIGDIVSLSGVGSYANKNVASSKAYSVTNLALSGDDSTNYFLSTGSSTSGSNGEVTPRSLVVSGITAANKVYDGTTNASISTNSAQYTGLVAGDNVVVSATGSFANKNIGINKGIVLTSTYSGVDVSNYHIADQYSTSANITAKPLYLSGAVGVTKTYDGNRLMPALQSGYGSPVGIVTNDAVTIFGAPIFNSAAAGAKLIEQGSVGITGADAGNYLLTWSNGSGTINRAPLTIAANDDAKFVTQADASGYAGIRVSGYVGGEDINDLTGDLLVRRINSVETAGVYTGVIQASGLSSDNYAITYVNGKYTIVPADQLLVRVNNLTTTYGDTATYTVESARYLDSDDGEIKTLATSAVGNALTINDGAGATANLTLVATSPIMSTANQLKVGSYSVGATSISENSGNFSNTITVVGAHEVMQKGLSVAVNGGTTKTYDGTTVMSNPTISESGRLTGDILEYSVIGNYSTSQVGTAKPYELVLGPLTGSDAANYYLTDGHVLSGTNGEIAAKALTVSGIVALNKVYDEAITAETYTGAAVYTGLVAGDDITVEAAAVFADKHAGNAKQVTITSTYSGADLGNYTVTDQTSATASILPKPVTLYAPSVLKTYDGSANYAATEEDLLALTAQLNPVNDIVTAATVTMSEKNVGTGYESGLTSLTIEDGNNGQNYDVTLMGNQLGQVERLASATWTGAAGDGKWFTPGNWANTDDLSIVGTVPDLANVASVVLPTGSSIVFNPADAAGNVGDGSVLIDSMIGEGSLTQTAGQLVIAEDGNLHALDQTAGRLVVAGNLLVDQTFSQGVGGTLDVGGDLTATQGVGDLTPQGLLLIDGRANLTASNGDVIVLNQGNNFGTALSVDGQNFQLRYLNPLTLAMDVLGDASLNVASGLEFGVSNIGGNLISVTGSGGRDGGVTQSGAIGVDGDAQFIADTVINQDALLNLDNNFAGVVDFKSQSGGSWRNVEIRDVQGGLVFGEVTTTGGLTATTSGGGISQTEDGGLTVGGSAVFDAEGDVVLDNLDNDFKGGVRAKGRYVDLGKDNPPKLDSASLGRQGKTTGLVASDSASNAPVLSRASSEIEADSIMIRVIQPQNTQGPVVVKVELGVEVVDQDRFTFELPVSIQQEFLGNQASDMIDVTTIDGQPLPSWIRFEGARGAFVASNFPSDAFPFTVRMRVGGRTVLVSIGLQELLIAER